MTTVETEGPTQQPGLVARSYASAQLVWKLKHYIPTVATTAFNYYARSSYHENWPLSVALFVALARFSSESARAQRALNPDKEIDVVVETQKNRKRIEGLIVPKTLPKNGAIHETLFKVKQRGLKGVLEESDKEESGDREIKAEWSAHDSLFTSDGIASSDKVVLYVHGGAYCLLSPKTHRGLCLQLSKELKARVLSIDYRLSPETKFPGALHDAVSAYFHLTEELKIPASNIIVGGDSAGGNLATALLLYLRDSQLPQISGGILLSPWVDFTSSFASWDSNASTDYLAMDKSDPLVPQPLFVRTPEDLVHPYVSPSISGSLKDLPPLIVMAGGGETLRDEITLFAQNADRDGVDVTHEIFDGGVHVFVAVMEKGMGKKGIENIGKWARENGRFKETKRVESEGWSGIGENLNEEWKKKEASLPPKKEGTGKSSTPTQERFLWEEFVEDAPEVKLRHDAHQAAVKALEENSRHTPRKGLTRHIRSKKNPEFSSGILGSLHL